jgi:hypothetical protein
MRIVEDIQKEIVSYGQYLRNVTRIAAVIDFLGLNELEGWASVDAILCVEDLPSVSIGCKNDESTLDEVARKLAKAGKVTKGFDESGNRLELTVVTGGVNVKVKFQPPSTCTVEKVEEEVEVPEKVVPAHTEKRVRFKLVGDCGPLLKAQEAQADPVVKAERTALAAEKVT